MISRKLWQTNEYLHSCPTHTIKTRPVTMGDNQRVLVDTCVQFTINLGGHWFEFIAFVMDMIEEYNFILGAKAMYKLEMDVSYSKMKMEFAMRGLPLKLQSSVSILSNTQKVITLASEEVPPDLRCSNLLICMDLSQRQGCWQSIMVNMKHRCVQILVVNDSDKTMKLRKGKLVASADMHSVGYFRQTQDALQAVLQQDTLFLSEHETDHYIDQCFLGCVAQPQNTWIVKTKPQEPDSQTELAETVKAKNKDDYPWLNDDNPRRNMTDKQIFEQYVDLSESDLTAREKQKMVHLLMKYRSAFSL